MCAPQESTLVPQWLTPVPDELTLLAQESTLVPQESTLAAKECATALGGVTPRGRKTYCCRCVAALSVKKKKDARGHGAVELMQPFGPVDLNPRAPRRTPKDAGVP